MLLAACLSFFKRNSPEQLGRARLLIRVLNCVWVCRGEVELKFHVVFDGDCPDTWEGRLIPALDAVLPGSTGLLTPYSICIIIRQLFWKQTAVVKLGE